MTHRIPGFGNRQNRLGSSARVPSPRGLPPVLPGASTANRNIAQDSTAVANDRPPPVPPKSTQTVHHRSMSHPFPSMLGTGDVPVLPYLGQASALEDRREPRTRGRQSDKGPRPTGGAGGKDFATGNCMTCGGLVRWPNSLKVFKCTTCATINDLEPTDEHESKGVIRQRDGSSSGTVPKNDNVRKATAPPVSLLHTKNIVRRCLQYYISTKLDGNPAKYEKSPYVSSRVSRTEGITVRSGSEENRQNANQPLGAQYLDVPTRDPYYDSSRGISKTQRSFSSGYSEKPIFNNNSTQHRITHGDPSPSRAAPCDPKHIFKPLEDYIAECFQSAGCLNESFMQHHYATEHKISAESRPGPEPKTDTEHQIRRKPVAARDQRLPSKDLGKPQGNTDTGMSHVELDPKLLLLGDVAENGLWWTGRRAERPAPQTKPKKADHMRTPFSTLRSLRMDWTELENWYRTIIGPADGWMAVFHEISSTNPTADTDLPAMENELLQGQAHVHRTLLKYTEMLLKRPRRPISDPTDLRFLLIILENPLLHNAQQPFDGLKLPSGSGRRPNGIYQSSHKGIPTAAPSSGPLSGHNSGIIKRLIGLISNSPPICHNHLISWWIKYEKDRYTKAKDLFSGFLAYRMLRQKNKKSTKTVDDNAVTSFLIPQMRSGQTGAQIHDEIGALRLSAIAKKPSDTEMITTYPDDWQVKATSRVLALIFAANDPAAARDNHHHLHGGHKLPSSDFYVSMIDYIDLVKDFDTWEAKQGVFSFCQYPFLLSVGAKISILEHDTRRQMQTKARDAFIDSIMSNKSVQQYLTLTVRRECLVDDSLMAVSAVIGSGTDDIKKGLRIKFRGEEGIDGGGLRKEWFQLVIRDVFNPDFGMFLYDEDSQYCYFNPNSLESTDQYFLVGVVLGLAIYNSTILDVPLPPFAFKKLLASVTGHGTNALAHLPPALKYTLDDLAEYRPQVARGLRQLLEYDGDVESTFALDFVVESERYGVVTATPLCEHGERRAVTNANRREYVDLYVRHVLDTSVRRQFDPFRRGFYNVCGGNAFSLFRPGEIELLVRGSDEPLDVNSMRAVAEYHNWDDKQPDGVEPVVAWFWETFQQAEPGDQRKLLSFITGSDRIPATGAASLRIKLSCLGDDSLRFPVARTCFNQLSLWRYRTRQKLEYVLWRAVNESEGFGLK